MSTLLKLKIKSHVKLGATIDGETFEAYIAPLLDLKVDKVTGKGLSTEDFTTEEKANLANQSNTNTGDQDLSNLVEKEDGKGLSANDYTTTEKNKLSGIESGAEVNQSDSDIKTQYENNANTNAFTDAEKTKVANSITAVPSDSVGVDELKDELKGFATIASGNIDFNYIGFNSVTLSADTTYGITNPLKGKTVSGLITGEHALTITGVSWITNDYDGTVWNLVSIYCADDTSGSEIYFGTIHPYTL